ncbi:protein-disulfide reductase DsbD [Vibrio sp. WXL103]|uniref:protein-disulfide reductase DsbD n=1 Tax=unclassified Vibrio TaxID=2614977 RepID=UPI003EC54AA1
MRAVVSLFVLSLSLISPTSWALFSDNSSSPLSFGSSTPRFLPVDEAFPLNTFQQGERLFIDWQVADGYYLYQDRIKVTTEGATLAPYQLRPGEPYYDEFFGDVSIYTTPLFLELTLSDYQTGARAIIEYQGCAKSGFCYPPETREIDLAAFISTNNATPSTDASDSVQASSASTPTMPVNNSEDLANTLADNWWTPLLFLLLGVGLAFTPCVLPMYPILTSIVLGQGQISARRALGLSLIYVQGMALTYTLLGLLVASAGMQFQAAMQHPAVLITLSVLFVGLSLSMFGVYTLQLPASAQTWLNNLSNRQQGGSTTGVFAMGAISGLVCSPCTTAPLSGALLYVAQSGDLITGATALYALALGMGIPLILVAVFGNKLLPKAGEWMDTVKVVFGFVLLAAPILLLERILPELWVAILWTLLGLTAFGWLYRLKNRLPFGSWKQSTIGIVAVLGMVAALQPSLNHWLSKDSVHASPLVEFVRIESVEQLEQQLALAKANQQPVMLDFYADWCVACKEFEKYTFHASEVEPELGKFVLLQADVTRNRAQDIALLQHLQVLGLPTIDFWNGQGERVSQARLTGFVAAEPFLLHIQHISQLEQ